MAIYRSGPRVRLNWRRLALVALGLASITLATWRLATPAAADAPPIPVDEEAMRRSLGTPPHPR
jgi:hypothetical protein